jgi:hypothetical protein
MLRTCFSVPRVLACGHTDSVYTSFQVLPLVFCGCGLTISTSSTSLCRAPFPKFSLALTRRCIVLLLVLLHRLSVPIRRKEGDEAATQIHGQCILCQVYTLSRPLFCCCITVYIFLVYDSTDSVANVSFLMWRCLAKSFQHTVSLASHP